jgi:hypothetical protein
MRTSSAGLFVAMFLLVSHSGGSLYAYLDPGTGSILLQTLLAAAVGMLAVGRLYWKRLKSFVLRRHDNEDSTLGD